MAYQLLEMVYLFDQHSLCFDSCLAIASRIFQQGVFELYKCKCIPIAFVLGSHCYLFTLLLKILSATV